MKRWGLYMRLDPVLPATLLGSVYWSERLHLAASANSALAGIHRNAVAQPEAGALATRLTAFKPSMYWFSYAQANLTPIPDFLKDEDVLLLSDIASTGFAAAENGAIKLGDTVAVFAQGPIGLCASLGAKLSGASEVFAVDADPHRLQTARLFGATRDVTCNRKSGRYDPG